MHTIIREGWLDETFIAERTEDYDALRAVLEAYPPERAAQIVSPKGTVSIPISRPWGHVTK